MVDVTPDYLLNIVDKETAQKIWESLEGMRIYFPKCKTNHNKIQEDYESMQKRFTTKANAIRLLSSKYEMSETQIRRIIGTKKKILFDVA